MRITLKYVCLAAAILQVAYSFPYYHYNHNPYKNSFEDYSETDEYSDSDDSSVSIYPSEYMADIYGIKLTDNEVKKLLYALLSPFDINLDLSDSSESTSEESDSIETQLEKPPPSSVDTPNEGAGSIASVPLNEAAPSVGSKPIPLFVPHEEHLPQNTKANSSETQNSTSNQENNQAEPSSNSTQNISPPSSTVPIKVSPNPQFSADANNTLILSVPSDLVNDVDGEGVIEKSNQQKPSLDSTSNKTSPSPKELANNNK